MKNKPTIQEANNQAISDFFLTYGEETKPAISKFLFLMALQVIDKCKEVDYTEEYLDDVIVNLEGLYNLVNELQDITP